MTTTPNMSLTTWPNLSDTFSHAALANNFNVIDTHDHSANKGVPVVGVAPLAIGTSQLQDASVTTSKLVDLGVTTGKLNDSGVTLGKLDPSTVQVPLGLGSTRRGAVNIPGSHSTSSASFTTLATPDVVPGIVLPTNGLIAVAYQATWQESVAGAARAAIFIGANQQVIARSNGAAPATIAAATNGAMTANTDTVLASWSSGLLSGAATSTYSGDVTTGQAVGLYASFAFEIGVSVSTFTSPQPAGPCWIFAAAGTYTVSVQFKASSGSVTAKNRKLWVWTMGF